MKARLFIVGLLAATTAGCSVDMGGIAFVNDRTASVRISTSEAVLTADGRCGGDANLDPGTVRGRTGPIALGMSECDLVRAKDEPPTDVLIGESGRGQREVQVLYAEPGGREIYLFVDNRLTRIIKPGSG